MPTGRGEGAVPAVTAEADVPGATGAAVWRVLADGAGFPALARHVLEVSPGPGGTSRWRVLLNGSEVGWVQRDVEGAPGVRRFEQVHGDLDALRGAWSVREVPGGARVALTVEFSLGVDGLAPLLDPIWAQAFQVHAEAMVRGVARAAGGVPDGG